MKKAPITCKHVLIIILLCTSTFKKSAKTSLVATMILTNLRTPETIQRMKEREAP